MKKQAARATSNDTTARPRNILRLSPRELETISGGVGIIVKAEGDQGAQ